jgi:hypothetical protein
MAAKGIFVLKRLCLVKVIHITVNNVYKNVNNYLHLIQKIQVETKLTNSQRTDGKHTN